MASRILCIIFFLTGSQGPRGKAGRFSLRKVIQ